MELCHGSSGLDWKVAVGSSGMRKSRKSCRDASDSTGLLRLRSLKGEVSLAFEFVAAFVWWDVSPCQESGCCAYASGSSIHMFPVEHR